MDFGKYHVKKSSAKITKFYTLEELIGKQLLAVANFSPRQIASFMSEVLVLGVVLDEGEVVLIQPDCSVPGITYLTLHQNIFFITSRSQNNLNSLFLALV
ncbi:hypothetical protein [Leptothermofonsia sp. ETS-13]|uniref:hypothetical protein n=1 Tax=Leptothermofonsia sp. ETS-13 TaxID=3035696 RepID=UPI003BA2F9AC